MGDLLEALITAAEQQVDEVDEVAASLHELATTIDAAIAIRNRQYAHSQTTILHLHDATVSKAEKAGNKGPSIEYLKQVSEAMTDAKKKGGAK